VRGARRREGRRGEGSKEKGGEGQEWYMQCGEAGLVWTLLSHAFNAGSISFF